MQRQNEYSPLTQGGVDFLINTGSGNTEEHVKRKLDTLLNPKTDLDKMTMGLRSYLAERMPKCLVQVRVNRFYYGSSFLVTFTNRQGAPITVRLSISMSQSNDKKPPDIFFIKDLDISPKSESNRAYGENILRYLIGFCESQEWIKQLIAFHVQGNDVPLVEKCGFFKKRGNIGMVSYDTSINNYEYSLR